MEEMVLLKCEKESRLALVLCPQCKRISRQTLKIPYSPMGKAELASIHTCPVCGAIYESCSLKGVENYRTDYARYNNAPSQYDDAAMNDYVQSARAQAAPSGAISGSPSGADKAQCVIRMPHTTVSLWQQLFPSIILQRGRTYYNAARVKNLAKNASGYTAVVSGTADYNVAVSYEGGEMTEMACNCPYARSGARCKHMAAVLYAVYGDGSVSEKGFDSVQTPMANPSSRGQASATAASCLELDRKIDFWQRELLDTGKRNKMINYRETKRSTLKILEPDAEGLFNQLAVAEKKLTFQKPISRETDIRTYSLLSLMETLSYSLPVTRGDIKAEGTIIEREKTLKNLRSKAKLAQEEQGANILYLCFGFIYWREHDRSSSPWVKSPLLMMPVTLEIKSLNAPYTLAKSDDEIEVNPTLSYLFNAEYNIDLPAFELKNKSSFAEYIKTIEKIVDRRGWKVVPEVSLGLLSFLKISMYHDLYNNRELMTGSPVLRAIAGDRSAIANIPAAAQHYDFDKADPKDWHEVVDSDSSQEEAILLSKMGVSFVMQGPPGTGKSQTITNIIAEAMADGKKVLFVSEKAAALQVVLKRLTEVGLSDFCLSLHNYKADKKEIIDSINANLSLQAEYVGNSALRALTELFHDRQYLDAYADELHRPIAPLGDSIYTVFGKLSRLENASAIEFSLENPMAMTREQYASSLYCISDYEKALQDLGGSLSENPWCGTKATSSGQAYKQELAAAVGDLAAELREMDRIAAELDKTFRLSFIHTWAGVKAGHDELRQALSLPLFAPDWLDPAVRSHMLSAAIYEEQEQKKYREKCESLEGVLDVSILDAPVDVWLERSRRAGETLSRLGYNMDLSAAPFSRAMANRDMAVRLIESLKALAGQYRTAEQTVSLGGEITFAKAEKLYALIALLEKNPQYIHRSWFVPGTLDRLDARLSEAKSHAAALLQAKALIAADWNDGVYSIDVDQISGCWNADCDWIYRQAGDMGLLLEREIGNAEGLLSEINDLMNAAKEAYSLLCYSGDDSIDSLFLIQNVLSLTAEAPHMEADWFDRRKNAEIMPFIDEAIAVGASIREKTNTLLADWESSVLSIDADGMLARFKTEYIGLFHKMKPAYREDIRTIRLNAKAVGKPVDEHRIIALLQQLKDVNEAKKWFDTHADAMTAVLGARYRGVDTDWASVQKAMETALQITALFPHGNIPVDTIQAICAITESLQLTGEARRIGAQMAAEKIEHCSAGAAGSRFIADFARSSSLRETVVPQIEIFIKRGRQQRLCIDRLKEAEKASTLSCEAIGDLLDRLILVRREEEWFEENAVENQELFAGLDQGKASDWDGIATGVELVKRVKALFDDGIVPDSVINCACADSHAEISTLSISALAPEKISAYRQAALAVIPHWNADAASVHGTIERLEACSAAAADVSAVFEHIRSYAAAESLSAEELLAKAVNAEEARSDRNEIDGRARQNIALFGDRYAGIGTEWKRLQQDILAVEAMANAQRTVVTDSLLKLISNDRSFRERLSASCGRLSDLVAKTAPEIDFFQRQFENAGFTDSELLTVAGRYEACWNGFGALNRWLDYAETRAECDKQGLADFTARIAAADNTIPDVREAFERGFYRQWIGLAMDTVPAVQGFRRRVHEQRIDRFIRDDEKQLALSRKRIRDSIISAYPETGQMAAADAEMGILRHEAEKKRRIMPLRKLFRAIPHLLLTLKPCLMMSPLSVAYFLEAGLYHFDMVIFDEASQIFPQDAVGAIFRANQVVIAGDTKQLPPTSFFASSTGNGDEGFDDEDSYDDEVYDSILEETANILPSRMLLWHYRSRHESLIAFSNREIYRGELVTFPSSHESERDTGVEFVYVEEGYYEGGGRNCNVLEARRIVQLIKEHVDRHPERSLGVIAFSEKQQNAIALEVQRFREKNPEYEDFFAEGREDEFFIKNLENVQGDERDTIIFSVGYAKTREQKANGRPMSMRFGPLGVQGGERRLNVAITRARTNIKLVSSILPSDIDLNRTESEGVRMLRSYIEFAMNGVAAPASARAQARPDDFADTVALFLKARGYKVSQYVGCSGYRIDIAVEHPSDVVRQFAAGVECDGYSYSASRTARDRDRLRGAVLKSMGWNMYRVWSAEWYKNPEVEAEKLIAFIENAIKKCDAQVRAIEAERREAEEALRKAEEAKRREQERLQAEAELARREAAKRPWEEEKRRKEAAQRAKSSSIDLGWLKKDVLVKHKAFGVGSVQKIEDGYVNIVFPAGEKCFAIPSAFETGFLSGPESGEKARAGAPAAKASATAGAKDSAEFIRALTLEGFVCIDHRSTSGIVWVLYSAARRASFEKMAAGYNVQYRLEKRGAMATKNVPAWRIMFN